MTKEAIMAEMAMEFPDRPPTWGTIKKALRLVGVYNDGIKKCCTRLKVSGLKIEVGEPRKLTVAILRDFTNNNALTPTDLAREALKGELPTPGSKLRVV